MKLLRPVREPTTFVTVVRAAIRRRSRKAWVFYECPSRWGNALGCGSSPASPTRSDRCTDPTHRVGQPRRVRRGCAEPGALDTWGLPATKKRSGAAAHSPAYPTPMRGERAIALVGG